MIMVTSMIMVVIMIMFVLMIMILMMITYSSSFSVCGLQALLLAC